MKITGQVKIFMKHGRNRPSVQTTKQAVNKIKLKICLQLLFIFKLHRLCETFDRITHNNDEFTSSFSN